jgi:hypothetical protein
MKRIGWGLVVSVTVVAGLTASTAGAAKNTSVTLKSHTLDAYLDGKVTSSKARCEDERRVKLFWDSPGAPRKFDHVAGDETNSNGYWRISGPDPPVPAGRYFAKVTKRGQCDAAKSETIRVKAP